MRICVLRGFIRTAPAAVRSQCSRSELSTGSAGDSAQTPRHPSNLRKIVLTGPSVVYNACNCQNYQCLEQRMYEICSLSRPGFLSPRARLSPPILHFCLVSRPLPLCSSSPSLLPISLRRRPFSSLLPESPIRSGPGPPRLSSPKVRSATAPTLPATSAPVSPSLFLLASSRPSPLSGPPFSLFSQSFVPPLVPPICLDVGPHSLPRLRRSPHSLLLRHPALKGPRICGISSRFSRQELKGCINDAKCMHYLLVAGFVFPESSIIMVTG